MDNETKNSIHSIVYINYFLFLLYFKIFMANIDIKLNLSQTSNLRFLFDY